MNISLTPGKYVVAVSGGVDSVVLLDLLHRVPDVKLTVAHFDHGMRPDSRNDRLFVHELAQKYNVPFVYDEGHLGAKASEAAAREVRYKFLYRVMQVTKADALITAHHEDDLLETAILNLLRGTGRKGLSSLKSAESIRRPLLEIPKQEVVAYARARNLEWHEDTTNADIAYLRNYVRHKLLSRFDAQSRRQLRQLVDTAAMTNVEIDRLLANQLHVQPASERLDRHWFTMLPHAVAREVLAAWLRAHDIRDFDKKTLERIVIAVKTLAPGKQIDVDGRYIIDVRKNELALAPRER